MNPRSRRGVAPYLIIAIGIVLLALIIKYPPTKSTPEATPSGKLTEVGPQLAEAINKAACQEAAEYGKDVVFCPVWDAKYQRETDTFAVDANTRYLGWFFFQKDWKAVYVFADYTELTQEESHRVDTATCRPIVLGNNHQMCTQEGREQLYLFGGRVPTHKVALYADLRL